MVMQPHYHWPNFFLKELRMNTFTLNNESKLTDRYQTTIPETVRKALQLNKRDKLRYTIQANGNVLISRVEDTDPVLDGFLNFLANDISHNPGQLTALNREFTKHIDALVSDVGIDLNNPLSDENE